MTGLHSVIGTSLVIREVGPRDGLQSEAPLPVESRVELIRRLVSCGIRVIEVASFVRDDLVPSMAKAEEVVGALPTIDGLTCFGLIANTKGLERAKASGLRNISVTISLSDAYSRKNVGRSSSDALRELDHMLRLARQSGIRTDVVISCSFGSPFDDVHPLRDLPNLLRGLERAGADGITLADTTGVATPRAISQISQAFGTNFGIHLHDTRGNALVNAYAAMQLGFSRFDTSLGGIGGSPFAPGAMGNLATEALVNLADGEGVATGIDLHELLEVCHFLEGLLKQKLPSRLFQAISH